MLCPKCQSETKVKKQFFGAEGAICRRRCCARGHWFDTRQAGAREKLIGDVISLKVLVLKQRILHGLAGERLVKLILSRHEL